MTVYYTLSAWRNGEMVLFARMDVGLSSHALKRATEILLGWSDVGDRKIDRFEVLRIETVQPTDSGEAS